MIITLDMETYYDSKIKLGFKHQTTEEYIRDPRFEIIGVGVKVNDEGAFWVSGTREALRQHLMTLDWSNASLLCHNTMFDGAILKWVYGITPRKYLDTLSMARAIHGVDAGGSLASLSKRYGIGEKGDEVVAAEGKRIHDFTERELSAYGRYCINDVNLTNELWKRMSGSFPQEELDLIDMTLRMFINPILEVDDALLIDRLAELKDEKLELLGSLKKELKCETEEEVRKKLASNKQFAALLQDFGIPVPMKVSPTTGKDTYALAKNDEGFIALTEHENPFIQQLCAVRLGTKSTIEESRIERFIDTGRRNRGRLPIPLKYYGAHTGRWSGCLVADTQVLVYNTQNGVETKKIVDVLLDDFVWDGDSFVKHEGVVFSGYQEVIEWDGIKGTENHVVFTDAGEISLREALQGAHRITLARSPDKDDVEAISEFIRNNKNEDFV